MAETLAIMNQKGGTGKTTTAVNLAAALTEKRKRVLLIDFDPQASATTWLGGARTEDRGLLDVLAGNGSLADNVRKTSVVNLDLIASSTWLVAAERSLAGEVGADLVFRKAVQRLPADRWDLILIDCPPSLGLLSVSALAACRHVLVPVESNVMALAGLASLLQTVERVTDRLNPELEISAILACRVDFRKNLSREVVERLRSRFGDLVLKTMIRENVRLAEAPSFGQPITSYDTRSAGAEDYRALAMEFLKRMKTHTKKLAAV